MKIALNIIKLIHIVLAAMWLRHEYLAGMSLTLTAMVAGVMALWFVFLNLAKVMRGFRLAVGLVIVVLLLWNMWQISWSVPDGAPKKYYITN